MRPDIKCIRCPAWIIYKLGSDDGYCSLVMGCMKEKK